MLTQTPRSPPSSGSFSFIAVQARRSTLKVPIRFTLITLWKISRSWGPRLPAVRWAQPMPAQQTEIRSPPSAPAAASTAAWTGSGSITFASTKLRALAQLGGQRLALLGVEVGDHDRRRRASCSARAVAAPSPEAPPATSALCPSIFIGAAAGT